MATFNYRAATPSGELRTGAIDGVSPADALERVRRLGLMPIEAKEARAATGPRKAAKVNAAVRQAAAHAIAELAVLLGAGLTLDRALAVCTDNIGNATLKAVFATLQKRVKEGAPLSLAMAEAPAVFPPMASAMAEAGEANGRLDVALERLAETLERAAALRQTVVSAMIYPIMLMCIAVGVIGVMLLFVVPQFEGLFDDSKVKLPFATQMVMGASHAVRAFGLPAILVLAGAGFCLRLWLGRPSVRLSFDRGVLGVPQVGPLLAEIDTARFARVLGSLVDGGVPLPTALGIAQRSIVNSHMSAAVGRVGAGLKRGGGLTGPLAATKVFPPMALSFLRTGEETATLGKMLERLADVLDRNVRTKIGRMVSVLTPAITVVMGAIVATVVASIMTAILGFNDLALAQ